MCYERERDIALGVRKSYQYVIWKSNTMLQNTVNNPADASHSVDEEPPEEAVDEELEPVTEEEQSDSELDPVEKKETD